MDVIKIIILCDKTQKREIEEYIGKSYNECLYLYLNYKKYGFDNKHVKLYMQKEENIVTSLVLTYYSGMHVYSKNDNFNSSELISFIIKMNPSIICAKKDIIKKLSLPLSKYNYESEFGWVREINNISFGFRDKVERAQESDFAEIAKLLYQDDDIGSSYKIDELTKQIKERNLEGYGRNYVIKDSGKIIAHAGTGAENDKVAVFNYLIVDPSYRKKGYATCVLSAVCEDLIKEGKKVYLINYTKESTALYDKVGFKISCEWGKLFLNVKAGESNE